MTDTHYMQRALELARKGSGWVNPNPQVGAVIVKLGRIVSEGYHARRGEAHAERAAINACPRVELLRGATLYVTLEPCCHTGKTPPCTEAIIEAGISRVVIGSDDPNPLVAGEGIARLREAGIEVVTGFMKEECDNLNRIFFHYIQTKTPYVLLKYAMTLDGKIATHTGASQWITGEVAREDVHRLRSRYAAIMVGMGTVLEDDPLLTCRLEGEHNPLRVICDSTLRIPLTSQIVQTAREVPTLIATTSRDEEKIHLLEEAGCEVAVCLCELPASSSQASALLPQKRESRVEVSSSKQVYVSEEMVQELPATHSRVDLKALMQLLGEREIDSVLIEGGPTLHGAALEAGLAQAVCCYVAPKLFGGADAPSPIGGLGVAHPSEAFLLKNHSVRFLGDDICIEGEVA